MDNENLEVIFGQGLKETTAMKKSQFTDQQIAFAVQQAEAGVAVEEVCRKLGISQQTFYRWK